MSRNVNQSSVKEKAYFVWRAGKIARAGQVGQAVPSDVAARSPARLAGGLYPCQLGRSVAT